tara:strand:- start:170 stop:445 length:276 start_codon:yes stop_codon:yes gene_type:complete
MKATELRIQDGRAISECKYCQKSKAPSKMSSRFICRDCSNSGQKKHQARLRAERREQQSRQVEFKTYPLSQSWENLASTVMMQQNPQGLSL